MVPLKEYWEEKKKQINEALASYLPQGDAEATQSLTKAMRYSLLSGGKRLRPLLTITSADFFGLPAEKVMPLACAMEMVHTYSLIHDDLPSLDNDDYRRNQPSCHKAFGEAMALLAGDALLTCAFQLLARGARELNLPAEIALSLIEEVAKACGALGMIGGQVADLKGEGRKVLPEELEYIHLHKTAELMKTSVMVGAAAARAEQKDLKAITNYGQCLGLAFQIMDDIADASGSHSSNKEERKATFPSLYGIEGAYAHAEGWSHKAIEHLEPFGDKAGYLRSIALFVIKKGNP